MEEEITVGNCNMNSMYSVIRCTIASNNNSEMYVQNIFYLQLIVASYASNIDIIRDYFIFKNVPRVAGFSCGNIESELLFLYEKYIIYD